jgi:hypothetical protein
MWYYGENNQSVGPVSDEAIQGLIQEGKLTAQTQVWREGMSGWQALSTTGLKTFLPVEGAAVTPTAIAPRPNAYALQKPVEVQIKELNDMFTWFWVCLIGSIVTFGLSAIASAVLAYIILYRCWALIQDGYARTTPGKAVGFLFIPFYNFYWIFEAFAGYSKDANAYIARHNLPLQKMDEGLSTAYCVCTLTCMVPYLNFLTGIAVFVLWIILLKQFKNTAVGILQYS